MLTESTFLETVTIGPDGKTQARQVTIIIQDLQERIDILEGGN